MFNNRSNHTSQHLHFSGEPIDVKIIKLYSVILYIIIITICIVGNAIVAITIVKTLRFRSTKNYFLLSIAIADLLIGIICMPSNFFMADLDDSVLNVFLCKSMPFLQGVTKSSSVYSFTAIALERCLVITKPYGNRPRKQKCLAAILCIWAFSVMINSPKLYVNNIKPSYNGRYTCAEHGWSSKDAQRYIVILITLTYFVPVIISSLAYGKTMSYLWNRQVPGSQNLPISVKRVMKKTLSRAKICRRMLRILLMFVLLHLPSTILTILWYFGKDIHWQPPKYIWIVAFHAEIVKYASSAINPILFCVLDPSFRLAIRSCFTCKSINQSERRSMAESQIRSTSV